MELHTALRDDPAEVGRTRALLGTAMRRWNVPDDGGVSLLLAGELVTNALRHGVAPMRLVARGDASGLRVEVHDGRVEQSPTLLRPAEGDDLCGRGMALIDALATRWGWSEFGGSKQVWFEVDPGTDRT